MSTSLTNLPTTPAEQQTVFSPANTNVSGDWPDYFNEVKTFIGHINNINWLILMYFVDENNTTATSVQSENVHPLTAMETDVYDNANSLQVIQ